jgi:malonyl-CoA O-methyltransferase
VTPEVDKLAIKNNFSKSAVTYDDHAAVQKKCAEKLVDFLDLDYFNKILEIGCGTGVYTSKLKERYPEVDITAIDISTDMVEMARRKIPSSNISFYVSDAEGLKMGQKFDLITSNASLQWFSALDRSFSRFSEHLSPGGVICFSIYGPETFKEFKEVLGAHFGHRKWLSSSRFFSKGEVEDALGRYFTKCEIYEENFNVDFFSIWDFLQNIKKSGTRGEGLEKGMFLGKYALREMERTYMEKFGGIIATHNVFFCKAEAV